MQIANLLLIKQLDKSARKSGCLVTKSRCHFGVLSGHDINQHEDK